MGRAASSTSPPFSTMAQTAIWGSSAGAKVIHQECGASAVSAVPVFPATLIPGVSAVVKPPSVTTRCIMPLSSRAVPAARGSLGGRAEVTRGHGQREALVGVAEAEVVGHPGQPLGPHLLDPDLGEDGVYGEDEGLRKGHPPVLLALVVDHGVAGQLIGPVVVEA